MSETVTVPPDPNRPGFDVLRGTIGRRPHFIHTALARAAEPLTAADLGRRAGDLARQGGAAFTEKTYSEAVTRNHLRSMRGLGFAEQVSDRRWQLTALARGRINATAPPERAARTSAPATPPQPAEVLTVDHRGRIPLPREFANATVTVERVREGEVRVRKAVVVPEADLTFLEDRLAPLSDRDRDLFLALLDNPPGPTPAFRAAAARYKERHG
ncbi:MAG: DUF1778 domain-containing protein [Gemmataceae bacterium]|nr:DUF1778 domain-containing protein [Gemmataceae bacterium]